MNAITVNEVVERIEFWADLKDSGFCQLVYKGDYVDGIKAVPDGYIVNYGGWMNKPEYVNPDTLLTIQWADLTAWALILAALATLGDNPQVWQRVESKISKTPVSPALVRVKLMTEAVKLADLPEPPPPQPVNNISGWTPRVKGMGRREWQGWKRSNGIK